MQQEKSVDAVRELYGPLLEDVEQVLSVLSASAASYLELKSCGAIKSNYIYLAESEEFKSDVERTISLVNQYNAMLSSLNSKIRGIWNSVVRNHRDEFEISGDIDENYFSAYLVADADFDENFVMEVARAFGDAVVPKFNLPPKLQNKFKEFLLAEAIRELIQQIMSLKSSDEVYQLRNSYSSLMSHCNYMKNGLLKKVKNPRTPWKYASSAEMIR
jgi:thiaminase